MQITRMPRAHAKGHAPWDPSLSLGWLEVQPERKADLAAVWVHVHLPGRSAFSYFAGSAYATQPIGAVAASVP